MNAQPRTQEVCRGPAAKENNGEVTVPIESQHSAESSVSELNETLPLAGEAASRHTSFQFCAHPTRLFEILHRVFSYPVALAAGLAVVTILTAINRFDNPDLWWHLKIGEIIWNTAALPSFDLFSFTAQGHPWIAHEWLAELTMYAAYKFGGYTGLMIWVSALASLTFLLVYLVCWLMTHNALVAFRGGMIAWCFGTVGIGIRPLLLGHLFLAAEILFLELARTRRTGWLWFVPPIFAMWVNCHGSYVFGIAVLAIYWITSLTKKGYGPFVAEEWGRRSRRLLGSILALSTAALFLNPIGLRLPLYPFDVIFHQRTNVNVIQEWFPPSLAEANTLLALAALGGVVVVSVLRRLSIRELLLVSMASGLALRHMRMMFLFGIIIGPVLCHFGWARQGKRGSPVANAAILCGCLIVVLWLFPDQNELAKQVQASNPVQAVRYLQASRLKGPMLNDYRFGGYLIWSLPERKVFIDGRTDVFDWTGVLAEYVRWGNLEEDPKLLLDKYGIQFCLLAKDSSVARILPYLPGWKRVYSDDMAVIFSR